MATHVSNGCSFGITSGGTFSRVAGQMTNETFEVSAILHSGTVRRMDLTPFLSANGRAWCERIAYRWGRANDLVRVYRRRASHRRMLARIGNYSRAIPFDLGTVHPVGFDPLGRVDTAFTR